MKQIDADTQARLEAGSLVLRDFLWIGARTRDTGALVERGWWSGRVPVEAEVKALDGGTVTRDYLGGEDLVNIGPVPLGIGMTVRTLRIRLSQIAEAVEQIVREYEVKRAPVEVHRGILDPASMRLPKPAVRRFYGFVDEVEIATAAAGEEGSIDLTCAPHSQELRRTSSERRSDASQRRRAANDGFYRHTATVGDWQIKWLDDD